MYLSRGGGELVRSWWGEIAEVAISRIWRAGVCRVPMEG